MALIGPVHDANKFSWDPKFGGIAEASDFGKGQFYGRLWNDACDEGFRIHNYQTQVTVPFVLVSIDRDREGDIKAWQFVAHNRLSNDLKLKVIVFND